MRTKKNFIKEEAKKQKEKELKQDRKIMLRNNTKDRK